jgi:hypothetical protein
MKPTIEETALKYKEELILAYSSTKGRSDGVKLFEFSYEDIESYYVMRADGMIYFEEEFLRKICYEEIFAMINVEVFQFRQDVRKRFVTAKKKDISDNTKPEYKALLRIIFENKISGRPRTAFKINGTSIRISEKTSVLRQTYRKITKPIRDCL